MTSDMTHGGLHKHEEPYSIFKNSNFSEIGHILFIAYGSSLCLERLENGRQRYQHN